MRILAVVLAAGLLTQCKSEATRQREIVRCEFATKRAGKFTDCLQQRYGWSEGEAADALIDKIARTYK